MIEKDLEMRHRVRKTKLGRRPDHQLALRRNLVYSLLSSGEGKIKNDSCKQSFCAQLLSV